MKGYLTMWLYNVLKWLLKYVQVGNVLIIPLEVSFGSPAKETCTTYNVPFTCSVDWRSLSIEQQKSICEHAKGIVAKLGVPLTEDTAARLRIDHVEVVL